MVHNHQCHCSYTIFWPSWAPAHTWYSYGQAGRHTYMQIKRNKNRENTSHLMVYLKALEQEKQNKLPNNQHEEIINIEAEINEIETMKKMQTINKMKVDSFKR